MSKFNYLEPGLAVAGQLDIADLQLAREAGFNSIVNNRPDHEEAGQPDNQSIANAARQLGMDFHFLPVISGQLLDSNVSEFRQLLPKLRQPVLMYCRTGTRCTHLWALSQAGSQDLQQIFRAAGNAGYDLTSLQDRLQQANQQK